MNFVFGDCGCCCGVFAKIIAFELWMGRMMVLGLSWL